MIRTTLLAHACLHIQCKDVAIITDPIFFDPHWEEINLICPARNLEVGKIPKVDVVFLSHRHQDHFDVRTLAYLRKSNILSPDAIILAPRDEILLEVLKALDYTNVRVLDSFDSIRIKNITLTPTPSLTEEPYPEHGFLIHDGEVTIWNQVDTVVNPQIVQYMKQLYGKLDFAHVRFMPLLEGAFTHHQSMTLPFDEYGAFLKVVKTLAPKFVVPGSAGFRYVDRFGFLNQLSFPTTPYQFLRDLSVFAPEVKNGLLLPGDVAEISREGARILPQSSDFVRMAENDLHRVEFKPVMEISPLRSLAQDESQHKTQREAVVKFVEEEMAARLRGNPMAEVWSHWNTSYQLEVFGIESSDIWTFDFAEDMKVAKGRNGKINLYEGIACSELYRIMRNETNWDFVGASAQYRTFHNVYKVENGHYQYYPQDKKFPRPLMEIFPADNKMDLEKFMKDVRRWKDKA